MRWFGSKDGQRPVDAYRKAIALNRSHCWSHYNLAEALVELEEWSEAIAAYGEAMKLEPNLPDVEDKINNALHRRIEWDLESAFNYYLMAIEHEPTDIQSYEEALKIQPDRLELYVGLANLLVEKR